MTIDHERNLAALESASDRAAVLLRSVPDANKRMPNSEWTIADAAAHTIASLRTYGGWVIGNGAPEQLGLLQKKANVAIARINEQRIATVDRTDGAGLAEQLLDATKSYVGAAKDLPGDHPFEWYDHITLDLRSMTSIMLAEVGVHMWDVARAANKPWPIDAKDAEQMMLGTLELAPYYLNKEAVEGVRASFEIRIRGGSRIGVRVENGVATIQAPPEGRYDCVISAAPVELLLVSYGRIGLAGPILKGKLLATGRKPWLGLKFNSYFLNP